MKIDIYITLFKSSHPLSNTGSANPFLLPIYFHYLYCCCTNSVLETTELVQLQINNQSDSGKVQAIDIHDHTISIYISEVWMKKAESFWLAMFTEQVTIFNKG